MNLSEKLAAFFFFSLCKLVSHEQQEATPPKNHQPPPQQKHHATIAEEEDLDEDVFLDETLYDEESQVLRDMEEREALASRLSKWKRPAMSQPYLSQSQSVGNFCNSAFSSVNLISRALQLPNFSVCF
ncbi:hypothetical protein Acr_05g0011380 [Actinidia rufa]|uniref:Uncharacterized protein n=1 Tax=Actinidia rufa TaxID=165716 RepID=A0A7J0ENE4_9ERIC|nr:hypothetical protein Acr_05g0011380 [Actinidia rufa]